MLVQIQTNSNNPEGINNKEQSIMPVPTLQINKSRKRDDYSDASVFTTVNALGSTRTVSPLSSDSPQPLVRPRLDDDGGAVSANLRKRELGMHH